MFVNYHTNQISMTLNASRLMSNDRRVHASLMRQTDSNARVIDR